MQKQKIILIIGIALALVAVVMTKIYLDQQRQQVTEQAKRTIAQIQANQSAVLVANQDIPKGAVIDTQMLQSAVVPNQYVQPQAVTSLDRISGMVTLAPISKGEQITLNKLMSAKEAGGGSLAMATPVGKRAMTISVDNISSLAGMLRPGDYVDVIGLIPVPVQTADGKQSAQVATLSLFQNVLVLAVGQETGALAREEGRYKKEEKKEISPLITLALLPQEVNMLAFVQEQSKIRLALRSPADSKVEFMQPVSWDTIFQYIIPKEAAKAAAEKIEEPKEEAAYVEIYRGANKEKVPLTK